MRRRRNQRVSCPTGTEAALSLSFLINFRYIYVNFHPPFPSFFISFLRTRKKTCLSGCLTNITNIDDGSLGVIERIDVNLPSGDEVPKLKKFTIRI